jgi:MYXO-CTERM domain-containing protein
MTPRQLATLGLLALASAACSAEVGGGEDLGVGQEALSAPNKAFCSVPVEGRGTKAMETDYIPHVITCENGGANLEALKAQAIAARSVAYYSMLTKGSICDSQGCQVYSCGAAASERAKKAAKETAGMYLSYGGTLTYAFYVAGDSGASAPGCKDYGGSTSHFVTYNAGNAGKHVEQTSLGYQGPPGNGQNRGCMSQWGARCLENHRDFNYMRILRFYYGKDITVSRAKGPCVPDDKTLRAKLTKKWSNARRYRGKKADYVVCAGDPLKLTFSFKNSGSATWRDVKHRGKTMGSDVFLVTANGKKDKLTGKKRFSLQHNANSVVRGDHKAKNCITKNGCKKTRFIKGGIKATAPKKPGIYTSRWRLRDYSKHWGKKSHGFGPKAQLRFKVVSCQQPKQECGCRVWCSNGKSHKLAASIDTAAQCKSVAQTYCKPDKLLDQSFTKCAPEPDPGTNPDPGTSPEPGANPDPSTQPDPDPGTQPEPTTSNEDPELEDEEIDNGVTPDDGDDGEETDAEVEDDPEFTDDGFDGDLEGPWNGDGEQSCAISAPGASSSGPLGALGLLLAFAAVARRRRDAGRNLVD